jgi:hypothetical protein
MAMVITMSTAGLAINKHYCGGKEKTKAIFFEADKCVSEVAQTCEKHTDHQLKRTACCDDRSSFFKQQIQVDIDYRTTDLSLDQDIINVAFSYHSPVINSPKKVYYVYRPPPLTRDIPVLFQSFLL